MKKTFLFYSVFIVLAACHNSSTLKNTSSDSTISKKATGYTTQQITGVFYDTLPCKNCLGIGTKMYIKPDSTFIIEKQNANKSVVYQTGTWMMRDSILELHGEDSLQPFVIISTAELAMPNEDRSATSTSLKQTILHRNNVPFKPVRPVPVEGVFTMANAAMNFHICTMQKTYPATLAPTALVMKPAYQKAAPKGENVYAKVAGHFELRPLPNSTTTQDFFVIEKFVKFIPNQSCKEQL